ncbi:sulfotransferase family 2 domain-containing protein [candidate division CSSED10-310 bacterium]|uniref:Sulfotransferase family 2 domain-containing protein n=1 Tax=candidate division CSSED10-310 bacterium TaxID=2855610 RepID=A0ABV6YUL9_UNCC1
MFISEKYKLIFLEVPRTASISITEALTRIDPESATVKRRQEKGAMDGYHSFDLPDEVGKFPLIFATHRNPYSRLWSFWKHRHKWGNPEIFKSVSWPRYVEWACDPTAVPEISGAMLDMPISEMFDCDRVSYWLKFESLRTSWIKLSTDYDLPLPALGWLNASIRLGNFQEAYNAELASMVAKRFAADFERFNYEVGSWTGLLE